MRRSMDQSADEDMVPHYELLESVFDVGARVHVTRCALGEHFVCLDTAKESSPWSV